MDIKRFVFNPFQENTYVIFATNGDCIIVDPGCSNIEEQKELTNFIEKKSLLPRYIVNTHCHFDHILGNAYLKAKYDIPILAHKEDEFLLESMQMQAEVYGINSKKSPGIDRYLREDDIINLGNDELIVVHLPGHSPGSIALYSDEHEFIVVGDVLFKGSIGRTDLSQGDYDQLMNSIRKKLFKYDDETVVYPGHGDETTIGIELKTNPFLF